jgi:hypothetical protein
MDIDYEYEFCATDNVDTMTPITKKLKNASRLTAKHAYGIRNKNTGMVCFPSTYSVPYTNTRQIAYDMSDVSVSEDGLYVGKRIIRNTVKLKTSDSDVNMGLQFIFDSTRSTAEDWEVVRYIGNTQHEDVDDDGRFKLPYLDGYRGTSKYRSYDISLYNASRDFMARLTEDRVIESEEPKEVEWEPSMNWKVINEIEVI